MKFLSGLLLILLIAGLLLSCARRRGVDVGLNGRRKPGHDCHCGVFHPM